MLPCLSLKVKNQMQSLGLELSVTVSLITKVYTKLKFILNRFSVLLEISILSKWCVVGSSPT